MFECLDWKYNLEAAFDPNHKAWDSINETLLWAYPILKKQASTISERPTLYSETPPPPPSGGLQPIYETVTAPTAIIGGPTPFSLTLLGSIYGALLGVGAQYALRFVFPQIGDYIAIHRLPILGAILGSIPGALIGFGRFREGLKKGFGEAVAELFRPFPRPKTTKKAQLENSVAGLTLPKIDETHWRDIVLGTPYLTAKERALAGAPFLAAGLAKGDRMVTPLDVAKFTAQTGLGAVYGLGLAGLAAQVLGLSPEARAKLQQFGILTGAIRALTQAL